MCILRHFSFLVLSLFPLVCWSQRAEGVVLNRQGSAVEGATVILLGGDSSVIKVAATGKEGKFTIADDGRAKAMEIRHIAYEPRRISDMKEALAAPIVLDDRSHDVGEVVVKAGRPIVRLNDSGGLVYDAGQMAESRPVTNTMDLIEEIPGVVRENEEVSVVGSANTAIVINGRRSALAAEDLQEMLSMMQPEQVKRIEVYYNAPARFGVKGSVINVVTGKGRSEKAKVNGSLHTSLYYGRKYYQTGGAAISMMKKRWQLSLDYRLGFSEKIWKTDLNSHHNIKDDGTHDLDMFTKFHFKPVANQAKVSFNHDIGEKGKLSIEYMWRRDSQRPRNTSSLLLDGNDYATSSGKNRIDKTFHTLSVGYEQGSTSFGGDYLHYNNDRETPLDQQGGGQEVSLRSSATQSIDKADAYFNQSRKLWGGSLSYGVDAGLTRTANGYESRWTGTTDYEDEQDCNTQHEYSLGAFIGMARSFGEKLRLTASLGLQYFRAEMRTARPPQCGTTWTCSPT